MSLEPEGLVRKTIALPQKYWDRLAAGEDGSGSEAVRALLDAAVAAPVAPPAGHSGVPLLEFKPVLAWFGLTPRHPLASARPGSPR